MLTTPLAGSLAPFNAAFAHGGLAGDDDAGNEFFWLYGILVAGIVGFIIYRKWWHSKDPPEVKALKRRISELERAHKLYQTQLQNAEDYPNEYGLTDLQCKEKQEAVASLEGQIASAKENLAAT